MAKATKRDQHQVMAAHIRRAASQPDFLCATSGSKSSGANNGSHSSGPSVRPTSHIHHGTIAPLPTSDQMRRSNTTGPGCNHRVEADPKEVADFRSTLKASGFPLLIPRHFLQNAQDLRNSAGLSSYVSKGAKGVKPGAKISPRHSMSLLPSWHETWMKAEDWLPVLKSQEDILWWRLGAGFHAHYGYPLEIIVDVDEMASSHGASRSMQIERVNTWLARIEQACIPPPDTIEFVNTYGCVDKMI